MMRRLHRGKGGSCYFRRAILLALFLGPDLLGSPLAHAGEARSVLILNSDPDIEKYRVTEEAFRDAWGGPSYTIGIDRKSPADAEILEVIRETQPMAVYCIGSRAYLVAHRLVKDKQLILSSAINWKRLPKSDGTIVVENALPADAQLTILSHVFPGIRRVGLLCSSTFNKEWAEQAVRANAPGNTEVVVGWVDDVSEVPRVLEELMSKTDAIWLVADPVTLANPKRVKEIFHQADVASKPVLTYSPAYVELGAILVIAPDNQTLGRQVSTLLSDCPDDNELIQKVVRPIGSEIMLNLRAVEKYNLELNEDALQSINRILR